MSRNSRRDAILEMVSRGEIGTQTELVEELRAMGYESTQATVSRDVRALKLVKRERGGRLVYALPDEAPEEPGADVRYLRVMRETVRSMTPAGNLLVIRTVTGMAMAAASALDAMHLPELVGDIAGDDTVFCAAADPAACLVLMKKLTEMIGGR